MQSYKAISLMIFAILLLPVLVNAEEAKASKIEKTFGSFVTRPFEDSVYHMNIWLLISILLIITVLLVSTIIVLVLYNIGLIGDKEPQVPVVHNGNERKKPNRDHDRSFV